MQFLIFSSCSYYEKSAKDKIAQNCDSLSKDFFKNLHFYNELVQSQPDSSRVECLLEIADNFRNTGDYQQFYNASHISLRWSEKYKNLSTAKSLFNLAKYFEKFKNYDSTFYYLIRTENILKRTGTDAQLATIYNAQARILILINNNLEAERYATRALEHSNRIQDKSQIFTSYALLGVSASLLKEFEVALLYHKKALATIESLETNDSLESECLTLNNIGNVYQEMKDYNRAVQYYRKAIGKCTIDKISEDVTAKLYGNYGYTLFKMENPLAFSYLKNSLQIFYQLESPDIVNTQLYLSEYFSKYGDTIRAINIGKKALLNSKKYNSAVDITRSLRILSEIDKINEIEYLRNLVNVTDSLSLAERMTRNTFARLRYETRELVIQKETADKHRRLVSASAALVILIISLILIIQVQRNKEKEMKHVQNQERANEEIYTLILDQQNKINEVRDRDRKRISADLHDGIMNKLTSTRLNLHVLHKRSDYPTVQRCLPFIDGIQEIEKEVREIAHDLSKGLSDKFDSYQMVLEELVLDQQGSSEMSWKLKIGNGINWDILQNSYKVHIYKIIQEVFLNIIKHSEATEVKVNLEQRDDFLTIDIFDNGIGFNKGHSKKGIGLTNINSRTLNIGGKLKITTEHRKGARFYFKIPLQ